MESSGDGLYKVHGPSITRLSNCFGHKAEEFFLELAKRGLRGASLHWVKEGEPTDGELIPVITFSLVEQL
jgi:hypothetical protein